MQFKKAYPKLHDFEKRVVDQMVDHYANKVVKKLGYRKANWLPCVQILLLLLFVLNVFACYYRPDFITQLIVVLSIFFLNDTEGVNRNKFRMLPLLLLMSIVYDKFFLLILLNYSAEASKLEGGLEGTVQIIAL